MNICQSSKISKSGEVFLEERNNKWNTPFLFNGKELDEETGLYYYGARYYDPRVSLFISTDRFAEKYPFASPYQYCLNNPINATDINGDSLSFHKDARIGFKIKATISIAINYIFSPTSRKNIKEAMSKETPMNIIKESNTDQSFIRPKQIEDWESERPSPELKFDSEKMEMVETAESEQRFEDWKNKSDNLTKHKDGTGDGTVLYLSFSKKMRENLKMLDPNRGYIHIVTAHEFGHIKSNNDGTNIYRNDGTNRNEIRSTMVQNATAKEFNRFRIKKFKTNVDQYGVLD